MTKWIAWIAACFFAFLTLLFAPPARAQPSAGLSVAVTPIDDRTGALAPDALTRIDEHLRDAMTQVGGYTVIAAQGTPDALRLIAGAAVFTTLLREGANDAVVAELISFETGERLGRGYAAYQPDPPETFEERLKAAITYSVQQISGRVPYAKGDYARPPPPPPPPYIPPPPPPPPPEHEDRYAV